MEDLTDWARVNALTDEEITAAAASDPDTIHPDDPWWQSELREIREPDVRKKRVSLSLDEDVIAWYRQWWGRGHHGAVNQVLRRFMEKAQEEEERRQANAAAE
jgi:uncharacterized protein (DUF4415 family)